MNKEKKTWDDWFCSWKFLFYTLFFFWPLSIYGYFRVKTLMKRQGVRDWGGFTRNLYVGTAVVMIPVITFFWWMVYLYITYYT